MVLLEMIPPLTLLSVGLFFTRRLTKLMKIPLRIYEMFLSSFVMGMAALVIPFVAIGVLFPNWLGRFVYFYLAFGSGYFVVATIRFLPSLAANFEGILTKTKQLRTSSEQGLEQVAKISSLGALIGYFFIFAISPPRGWDALHFYFSHALVFFISEEIPIINPLNLIPVFKPPLVSVLLSYTFFSAGLDAANYIPFLFLLGVVSSIYGYLQETYPDTELQWVSVSVFLAMPITYFLVYEWAYYQDLPIAFFYGVTFFFLAKLQNSEKFAPRLFWIGLLILSLGLAPLTKMSGYALFFVYLVSIRVPKHFKLLQIAGFLVIAGFLTKRAATEIHIIIAVTVAIITIFVVILLATRKDSASPMEFVSYVIPMIIGFLPGLAWLYRMIFVIPGTKEFLLNTYYRSRYSQIQWKWGGIAIPEVTTYIENAHRATAISAALILFTGSLFVAPWLFAKLFGLRELLKDEKGKQLLIFGSSFLLLWTAYFSNVSARYLTALLMPFSIVIGKGVIWLFKAIDSRSSKSGRQISFILFLLLGYGGVYPFYPFELVFKNVHLRYYLFHKEIWRTFLYILGFTLVMFLIALIKPSGKVSRTVLQKLRTILLIVLVITPSLGQLSLIAYSGFSIKEYQTKWVYDYRESIIELSEILQSIAKPDEITITVNVPGLEFFSQRPVLDLMTITRTNLTSYLNDANTTRLLSRLNNANVRYVVTLRQEHDFYPAYVQQYFYLTLFRYTVSGYLADLIYTNGEFALYRLHSPGPRIGPSSLVLKGCGSSWIALQDPSPYLGFEEEDDGFYLELDLSYVSGIVQYSVDYALKYSMGEVVTRSYWENNTIEGTSIATTTSLLIHQIDCSNITLEYFYSEAIISTIDGREWRIVFRTVSDDNGIHFVDGMPSVEDYLETEYLIIPLTTEA